jgi:predicted nuclease of predicted toxin-antitoxin system
MRFLLDMNLLLLDMNLPPAIAARLRAEGHDAIHVRDAGYGNLPDREIFARAAEDHRIIVSCDLDFGEIAGSAAHPGSGVILLRLKLARQAYLWDRIQVAIAAAGDAMDAGAIVLVEDARIRIRRMEPEG